MNEKHVRKLIEKTIESLKYIHENIWIIGFSGGKDSSLLVDIIMEYLIKTNREYKVYIMYADTLLEYPPLKKYVNKYIEELEKFIKSNTLNVEFIRVRPEPYRDFLSYLLLKGYPMPHRRFRWCTEKLKIIPVKKKILEILSLNKEQTIAFINGARIDESRHRKSLMRKRQGEEFTEKVHIYVSKASGFGVNANVYSPLAYLSEDDVWTLLKYRRHPFFTIEPLYDELLKLYGKYGKKYSSKDNIRYGCWLCTVATRDKSGEYLSKVYKKITLLMEARQVLFSISHKHNKLFRKIREKCNKKYNKECYGSLNEEARYLSLLVFKRIINEYPEALKTYIELPDYSKIIKEAEKMYENFADNAKKILINNINNTDIRKIYDFLKDYL